MLPKNYFRRIAVDCDDVLVDFMGGLADWHNKSYGTQLTKEDFRDGLDMSSVVGLTREEGIERIMQYVRLLNECKNRISPAISGAREALNYLHNEGFDFALVTARSSYSEPATFEEMRFKFPGLFSEIYFSLNKAFGGVQRKSKAQICLDERLDLLIEDTPRTALECADAGIYVLLFNQPWNQKCSRHPNIKRVRSWDEVVLSI
jgi:uncharacterized HAD superfamily protein